MKFCHTCGARFDDLGWFCSSCGAPRDLPPESSSGAPPTGPGQAAVPVRGVDPASMLPPPTPVAVPRTALLILSAGVILVVVLGLVVAVLVSDEGARNTGVDTGSVSGGGVPDGAGGRDLGSSGDYQIDSRGDNTVSGVTGSDGEATIVLYPEASESLTLEVSGDSDLVLSTIDIDNGEEISSDSEISGGTEIISIYTISDEPWTITVSDYSGGSGEDFYLQVY